MLTWGLQIAKSRPTNDLELDSSTGAVLTYHHGPLALPYLVINRAPIAMHRFAS